jgi:hypothetical protein
MVTRELSAGTQAPLEPAMVVRAVTVIMGAVVGLTFLFGFGNVWTLALRLGVPVWVAPLVAPAVDLSILGLLLGSRHLALAGATKSQLQPARRLLIFASVVTLALNVADPIVAGEFGKAAFDAVGPLLLIGWAEVGPDFLRSLAVVGQAGKAPFDEALEGDVQPVIGPARVAREVSTIGITNSKPRLSPHAMQRERPVVPAIDDLLERARKEDARHWEVHRRPVSAETLRRSLHVGAARSRLLVAMIRAELPSHLSHDELLAPEGDG